MSHHDYRTARAIDAYDHPFAALIMAAMRKADTSNMTKLRTAFPDISTELQARYDAPGGYLAGDPGAPLDAPPAPTPGTFPAVQPSTAELSTYLDVAGLTPTEQVLQAQLLHLRNNRVAVYIAGSSPVARRNLANRLGLHPTHWYAYTDPDDLRGHREAAIVVGARDREVVGSLVHSFVRTHLAVVPD